MLPPISSLEKIAKQYDLRQAILIAYDGEQTHIVTYGRTKEDCKNAAIAQDFWQGKFLPRMKK